MKTKTLLFTAAIVATGIGIASLVSKKITWPKRKVSTK
ncbi:MAG: hypothetical protein ACJAXX_000723 [Roseivirga sp.]|jgi:hypothetical protein